MAYAAAGVGFAVYFIGSVACFFLPEPREGTIEADSLLPEAKEQVVAAE
jgi:hypothetical protein